MLKNAIAYILRKKSRTVIIFIILTYFPVRTQVRFCMEFCFSVHPKSIERRGYHVRTRIQRSGRFAVKQRACKAFLQKPAAGYTADTHRKRQ